MLSANGVSCNEYARVIGRNGSVPAVSCPAAGCQGRLQRGHGFHKRYVDGVLLELRRLICLACAALHLDEPIHTVTLFRDDDRPF